MASAMVTGIRKDKLTYIAMVAAVEVILKVSEVPTPILDVLEEFQDLMLCHLKEMSTTALRSFQGPLHRPNPWIGWHQLNCRSCGVS